MNVFNRIAVVKYLKVTLISGTNSVELEKITKFEPVKVCDTTYMCATIMNQPGNEVSCLVCAGGSKWNLSTGKSKI